MKTSIKILLLFLFAFLILFVKLPITSANCNCPGGGCDHCEGGSNPLWGDRSGCNDFSGWAGNSGGCDIGGPGITTDHGGPCPCNGIRRYWVNYDQQIEGFESCTPTVTWGNWSTCSVSCGGGTQTSINSCGSARTQNCNTLSCYIPYTSPTPTPTPPDFTPTPTPVGYTPTPSPTPSTGGYFPGWFKTENGDVHSNKDIIVSLPTILIRFATYLVTTSNLSSFAAGSANDARPELASVKNWYWYSPPYGAINFPENAGFFSYYTHNKPPDNKIVSDALNNSTINSLAQSNKTAKIQIDSTINTVSINESITLSSDKILILYINGDLNINANITLNDNSGIVFVVKGNLNIAPQVTQADGFYLVDSTVNSTDGSGAGNSLLIHGGVFVSQNGKIFGTSRQIHDANTPSEKIVYEPKYLIAFAQGLGHSGITWREVAP